MWKYKCLHCGARLDPGEKCDCQDERQRYLRQFRMSENGQYQFIFGGMNENNKDTDKRYIRN